MHSSCTCDVETRRWPDEVEWEKKRTGNDPLMPVADYRKERYRMFWQARLAGDKYFLETKGSRIRGYVNSENTRQLREIDDRWNSRRVRFFYLFLFFFLSLFSFSFYVNTKTKNYSNTYRVTISVGASFFFLLRLSVFSTTLMGMRNVLRNNTVEDEWRKKHDHQEKDSLSAFEIFHSCDKNNNKQEKKR